MKSSYLLKILALLLLNIILLIIFLPGLIRKQEVKNITDNPEIGDMIKTCSTSSNHSNCYTKEMREIYPKISMSEAFKIIETLQKKDVKYYTCHELAHEIGAMKIRDDPGNWKEIVSSCPMDMCSTGCLHGAVLEKFSSSSQNEENKQLISELGELCKQTDEGETTEFGRVSCLHALGHALLIILEGNSNRSLALCDELIEDKFNYRSYCYDGIFMQAVQPQDPSHLLLVDGKKINKENIEEYCAQFSGEKWDLCHFESWPFFKKELGTPEGLIKFCEISDLESSDYCYDTALHISAQQLELNVEKIVQFCQQLGPERRSLCYAKIASRIIIDNNNHISMAISLCNKAEYLGEGEECFDELIKMSNFIFNKDSDGYYKICEKLPTKWKEKCLVN